MGRLDRYPDWGPQSRNTDPRARVCRFRRVTGVRAVRVTDGSFRSAPVSGVFELYEPDRDDPIEVLPSGKRQVKVICAWRGGKPNGSGIGASINLSGATCRAEVIENFSGEVVDNIGYPSDPAPLCDDARPEATTSPAAEKVPERVRPSPTPTAAPPNPSGGAPQPASRVRGQAVTCTAPPAEQGQKPTPPIEVAGTITTQSGDPVGRLQRTKLMLEIAAVAITVLSGLVALVFRLRS